MLFLLCGLGFKVQRRGKVACQGPVVLGLETWEGLPKLDTKMNAGMLGFRIMIPKP